MNVADAIGDLVVGDLRLSVVVDLGREPLRGIVLRANDLGMTVDRVLNEGEQGHLRLVSPNCRSTVSAVSRSSTPATVSLST